MGIGVLELLTSENVLNFLAEYGVLGLIAFVVLAVVAIVTFAPRAKRKKVSSKSGGTSAGRDATVQQIGTVTAGEIGVSSSKSAGGDFTEFTHHLHFTNVFVGDQLDRSAAVEMIGRASGLSESELDNIFKTLKEQKLPPLRELERAGAIAKHIAALGAAKQSEHYGLQDSMNITDLKISAADQHLNNREFINAHQDFEYILDHPDHLSDDQINDVINKYLHSGLICYGVTNKRESISKIADRIADSQFRLDRANVSALADVMQELGTRSVEASDLESVAVILESFKQRFELTPEIENSLGLAYRRIGERDNLPKLELAIQTFNDALGKETSSTFLRADILNNQAIAFIRKFEAQHQYDDLDAAKSCLDEAIEISERLDDYKAFMLRPKLFNNYGNLYKQKQFATANSNSVKSALEKYQVTEKWWTEQTAPYEWAMVRKNIAEVTLSAAQTSRNISQLASVVSNCVSSVRYRNFDNSPFQWSKTVQIALRAQLELFKLGEPMLPETAGLIQETEGHDAVFQEDGFKDLAALLDRVRARLEH